MTLKIYGSPRSRTMRVLWMAAELGLEYEHEPISFDDPTLKKPEFLRLNPAGAIPTIVDDGFALSESLAINLYLAKKYGSGIPYDLYPSNATEEAEVWRWTLWAQGHLEPWVQEIFYLHWHSAELREPIRTVAEKAIAGALEVLERLLTKRRWLVGANFTVCDLNLAAVLSPSRAKHLDLERYGRVSDWLKQCYSRPAAVATRSRFSA